MKKPILITTLGFPGSGKTYFSERLAKEENFFHINSDKIRFTLFENPTFSREEHGSVFRIMDSITESLLKIGVSVVYDANLNFRIHRKKLESLAKKNKANYCLVWLQTDVSVAEKRLGKRALLKSKHKKLMYRPLELKVLHDLKNEMQEPINKEPHVIIDGHLPFSKQISILRKKLKYKK